MKLRYRAIIYDRKKKIIGAKTYDTWAEAAAKLCELPSHPDRKYSSIKEIFEVEKPAC